MTKQQTKQTIPDLFHQVRNQLTYIMLSTDILYLELQEFISEEQRDEFQKINIAAEEIRSMDAIDELHPAMVVMGTSGRHGLKRWLLGSVAERVARYADRPVLILPPRPALALASPGRAFTAVTEAVAREEQKRTSRKNGKARRSHPALPGH